MFEGAPTVKVAKKGDFWVLPENWAALELFNRLQTQWNYISGMTVQRTGFNYPAVETVMRLCYPNEDHADLFNRLQIIETEALKLLNEK